MHTLTGPLFKPSQAVAKQLLEDMKMRGGKVSTMPLGGRLDSWQRAEIAMHAQDQPKKVWAARRHNVSPSV